MKSSIVILTFAVFANIALAADTPLAWPQFRGPNGSGVADSQKPPVELGPEKNVKWKVSVPSGISSPIVVGNMIVITAFDEGKLYTIAYNAADGKERWRTEAPAKEIEPYHNTEGSPATSTSATDGQRIVSYFGSCGLVCYDLSGKQLWKFEMPTAATLGEFGSGTSPIIVDGTVVLVRDEKRDPKVIAVDAKTGARKWEQKRLSVASYCSPVVWETADGKQIVSAGHGRLIGYDLKTGAEKWFVNGMPAGCCPSPVTADGNLFFAGGGSSSGDDSEMQMPPYDSMLKDLDKDKDGALSREEGEKAFGGFFDNQDANKDGKVTRDEWDSIIKFMSEGKNRAFVVKPGGSGDVSTSHVPWMKTKGLPYLTSAIVYRGHLVMVKDGGIVTAYDTKTGEEVYQERIAAKGQYYASPVAANGHIYFTTLDGAVTVLKVGSGKPEVAATNPKLDERTAATPAIANDVLFVRTATHLYAFAAKK